jgi:acyl carrier protein
MSRYSAQDIETTIHQLIRELCPGGTPTLTPSAHLADDLGYHSLALVELAFAIEDKFDLEPIDQGTGQSIRTVADVVGYVKSKVLVDAVSAQEGVK